jgi:hypothetical protein
MSKSKSLKMPNSDLKLLLMNYITNNVDTKIKIPHNTVEILKVLIKNSSNEFDKISVSLQEIIEDNVIDFKDVPALIILIENLYKLIMRHRKKLAPYNANTLAITSGEILKIIIKILVEMEHFNLSSFIRIDVQDDENKSNNDENSSSNINQLDKQKLIINSNQFIDACVKLILIPINSECGFARKIFSCCN